MKRYYVLLLALATLATLLAGCEYLFGVSEPQAWTLELSETNASKWFGGDDRDGLKPRNVGVGQSLEFAQTRHLDTFAFLLSEAFDYVQDPENSGHAVTLALDIRLQDGTVLSSYTRALSASFDGGWATFDVDQTLQAGQVYVLTCYVVDGAALELSTGVQGYDPPGGGSELYENGQGYSATVETVGGSLQSWSEWSLHAWDFCFKATGTLP